VLFCKDDVDSPTRVARSGSSERGLQICRGGEELLSRCRIRTQIQQSKSLIFCHNTRTCKMQNNTPKQTMQALVLAPTTPHTADPLLLFCHYMVACRVVNSALVHRPALRLTDNNFWD
jgi:hypothetical protein